MATAHAVTSKQQARPGGVSTHAIGTESCMRRHLALLHVIHSRRRWLARGGRVATAQSGGACDP
eukprot:363080-Chlamydomonas_euryale.AAC.2